MISLDRSLELSRQVTAQYAKTFYLGSLLLPTPKRHAIWAIYAWLRLTDELLDGLEGQPQSPTVTRELLQTWSHQLEQLFASGIPARDTDLALLDAIERYNLSIDPFRDMLLGQEMDLDTNRYATWDELHLYCYRVAGTVGLMSSEIMGFEPQQNGTQEAIALGIAMQLTNILRDVGEDARRGRIYLPQEDLKRFNYSERDLFNYVIDERWMALMDYEIKRARDYYAKAESGISTLQRDSRWPVWASLMLYRRILDAIERNHYQVFRSRAYVSTLRKAVTLPVAWWRAQYSG
ncbi:MAG: phytoene synthase [Synechococcaceae cyanobacterium SM2_3_2]|nr:phytoene synthase [Synechococcaceae cyanobacterium SM2_3_2]